MDKCVGPLERFICRGIKEGDKVLCRSGCKPLGLTKGKSYHVLKRSDRCCWLQIVTDEKEKRILNACPFFTGPDLDDG